VNAIAPYILDARLKPLMVAPAGHRHIATSRDGGQFLFGDKRTAPAYHMAQAALT